MALAFQPRPDCPVPSVNAIEGSLVSSCEVKAPPPPVFVFPVFDFPVPNPPGFTYGCYRPSVYVNFKRLMESDKSSFFSSSSGEFFGVFQVDVTYPNSSETGNCEPVFKFFVRFPGAVCPEMSAEAKIQVQTDSLYARAEAEKDKEADCVFRFKFDLGIPCIQFDSSMDFSASPIDENFTEGMGPGETVADFVNKAFNITMSFSLRSSESSEDACAFKPIVKFAWPARLLTLAGYARSSGCLDPEATFFTHLAGTEYNFQYLSSGQKMAVGENSSLTGPGFALGFIEHYETVHLPEVSATVDEQGEVEQYGCASVRVVTGLEVELKEVSEPGGPCSGYDYLLHAQITDLKLGFDLSLTPDELPCAADGCSGLIRYVEAVELRKVDPCLSMLDVTYTTVRMPDIAVVLGAVFGPDALNWGDTFWVVSTIDNAIPTPQGCGCQWNIPYVLMGYTLPPNPGGAGAFTPTPVPNPGLPAPCCPTVVEFVEKITEFALVPVGPGLPDKLNLKWNTRTFVLPKVSYKPPTVVGDLPEITCSNGRWAVPVVYDIEIVNDPGCAPCGKQIGVQWTVLQLLFPEPGAKKATSTSWGPTDCCSQVINVIDATKLELRLNEDSCGYRLEYEWSEVKLPNFKFTKIDPDPESPDYVDCALTGDSLSRYWEFFVVSDITCVADNNCGPCSKQMTVYRRDIRLTWPAAGGTTNYKVDDPGCCYTSIKVAAADAISLLTAVDGCGYELDVGYYELRVPYCDTWSPKEPPTDPCPEGQTRVVTGITVTETPKTCDRSIVVSYACISTGGGSGCEGGVTAAPTFVCDITCDGDTLVIKKRTLSFSNGCLTDDGDCA